jgi:NAD-dependent deacetylase
MALLLLLVLFSSLLNTTSCIEIANIDPYNGMPLKMEWKYEKSDLDLLCLLSFVYDKNSTVFNITCNDTIYKQFDPDMKSLFSSNNNTHEYHYTHGEQNNNSIDSQSKIVSSNYYKLYNNKNTHISSTVAIAEIIKNKKVALYTGAGISAGIVPTMKELESSLHFYKYHKLLPDFCMFLKKIIKHQDSLLQTMSHFYNACINGNPSTAHYAVAQLVADTKWQLITENVDLLHQKTGLVPILATQSENIAHIQQLCTEVEYILAIGLSEDQSNFLSYFKKFNPTGIIIGCNLVRPDYLSDTDIWLAGDIQKTLPELAHTMSLFTSKK